MISMNAEKKVLFSIVLLFSVTAGCMGNDCTKPYILHNGECCLDQNDNGLCDVREFLATTLQTTSTMPYNYSAGNESNIPVLQIPEKPVVGESMKIRAMYLGSPVSVASVTLTSPSGVSDFLVTSSSGEVVFTPTSVGKYTIIARKENFGTIPSQFYVKKRFTLNLTPNMPEVGEETRLFVGEYNETLVEDASVLIESSNKGVVFRGKTSRHGEYYFNLPENDSYTIIVEKQDFWPQNISFSTT